MIEFSVQICPSDISFEKEKSAHEDEVEGIPVRQFSDKYLETLAVYRKIARKLLEFDTLLFHGSVVAVDGTGYLFTAKSGTGKSTHTRLWRQLFGSRAVMANDDKPLLKITDNGVIAYGTPWNGKHRLGSNISIPLRAICILGRGETNHIQSILKSAAFPMLVQQSYRPSDAGDMRKILSLADRLGSNVRLYKLTCNMEQEAAWIAFEGMQQ
ncbi:MAG: hypothetical protein Q4E89_03725 [Eubacteriales bacterium]|nr:hypothetical protein [Eubacteriales bacterium]